MKTAIKSVAAEAGRPDMPTLFGRRSPTSGFPRKLVDGGRGWRDNSCVGSYWATDDGWPYRDMEADVEDPDAEFDDDLLLVRMPGARLLDRLEPLERQVIAAHYGLDGPARSMKQLRADTGLPRADLRVALGSGLAKLRTQLTG